MSININTNKHKFIMRIPLVSCCLLVMLFGCSQAGNGEQTAPPVSQMGLSTNSVTVNGLNFHYVEKGSGQVMLLLHGFPYFGSAWYKVMHAFADDYQVIAPDNRGYGYSDKPDKVSEYHIEKLVSDVKQLIQAFSPNKKVILVGHDWGAALAWGLAQVHPELVSKVIIINGAPTNVFLNVLANSKLQREQSKYLHKLNGWFAKLMFAIRGPNLLWRGVSRMHESGQVDDKFKSVFIDTWNQSKAAQSAVNWYVANFPLFDEIEEQDYWPSKQAQVFVPSLLIWSKDDPAFSQDVFNAIPSYVNDLSIEVIDTSSHTPFLDHSEQVIAFMRKYLKD